MYVRMYARTHTRMYVFIIYVLSTYVCIIVLCMYVLRMYVWMNNDLNRMNDGQKTKMNKDNE